MEPTIELSDTLNVSSVARQREQLQKALKESQAGLRLNAQQLASIDTAGLQLLVVVQQEARRQSKAFALVGSNDMLRSQCQALGLVEILAL